MNKRAKKILDFWFKQTPHKKRFSKNKAFDEKIRNNFLKDYQKAIKNEYDNWQNNIDECLALIILLDQFSRNLFRNNSKAFSMDNKAKKISSVAVKKKYHENLSQNKILFIFLPFMHSEKLSDQVYCNKLIDTYLKKNPSYKDIKKYAQLHEDIIKKFKRFPYRNKVLKRKSTKKEKEYLNSTKYDFFNI